MNVFIEYSSYGYEEMFRNKGWNIVFTVAEADIVCFTGGADVSPHMYGDKKHSNTYDSPKRDAMEALVYAEALERGIPCVGICRGGQFLNVMNGGRMYQDVSDHGRAHSITDLLTGETLLVSSTHHQMMMPAPGAILVASSTLGGSREWMEGSVVQRDVSKEDIEVVLYPNTKSLCFQPHPEFVSPVYTNMTNYFFSCIERYLIEEEETV